MLAATIVLPCERLRCVNTLPNSRHHSSFTPSLVRPSDRLVILAIDLVYVFTRREEVVRHHQPRPRREPHEDPI